MARSKKRRESHRCSIVGDGATRRAEIVIALDQFETPADDGRSGAADPPPFALLARSIPRCRLPGQDALVEAGSGVSVVIDPFVFRLFVGDDVEAVGTHDGDDFRATAVEHGVDVYVTDDLSPRRASADDLTAAASEGRLLGAHVAAFPVDIA